MIILLWVYAQRGLFGVPCFPYPPPLSDENHLSAALCMCRNYFPPYLSILACATEVWHNKENFSTIIIRVNWKLLFKHYVLSGHQFAKVIYLCTFCRKIQSFIFSLTRHTSGWQAVFKTKTISLLHSLRYWLIRSLFLNLIGFLVVTILQ